MPQVIEWLKLYGRTKRYGIMPEAGGLADQDERTLHAFDVINASLNMARVHDEDINA